MSFFKRDVPRPVASAIPDSLAWCRTTRCPECRAAGHLDRIDLVDSTTSQHCPDCAHRWQTSDGTAAARPV